MRVRWCPCAPRLSLPCLIHPISQSPSRRVVGEIVPGNVLSLEPTHLECLPPRIRIRLRDLAPKNNRDDPWPVRSRPRVHPDQPANLHLHARLFLGLAHRAFLNRLVDLHVVAGVSLESVSMLYPSFHQQTFPCAIWYFVEYLLS